jgi:hypothetical protein
MKRTTATVNIFFLLAFPVPMFSGGYHDPGRWSRKDAERTDDAKS